MKLCIKYSFFLLTLLVGFGAFGQSNTDSDQTTTRILFLMDGSKSMTGKWNNEEKFDIARKVLGQLLDSLKQFDNIEVALRVYGHTKNYPPQNCNDTRLEVPFSKNNHDKITYRLKRITPRGTSPIAASLEKTSGDFPACDNCRNVVILITDGIEECNGDICEVSNRLQQKGIILKPFIIGIGRDTHEVYDCAGDYYNAADKEQFMHSLKVIITRIMSTTSLQVNLLDQYNKPTESNVNMTFIDKSNNLVAYNFVHSLNSKGLPDTIYVDHLKTYKIIVNTIPAKVIDNVHITEGKHNIVSTECPRGTLMISLLSNASADFNPSIRITKNNKRINNQYLDQDIEYLSGKYDLEIQTLPPITLKDIEVIPDNQTKVEIESPGILAIQKSILGYGSIYLLDGKEQKWVVDFGKDNNYPESVYLQPGNYRLVFRSKYSIQSATTQIKEFNITSEKTTRVKL